MTAVGLALVWLVTTHTFVNFLATRSPEKALLLRSDDALALVEAADRKLQKYFEFKKQQGSDDRDVPADVIAPPDRAALTDATDPADSPPIESTEATSNAPVRGMRPDSSDTPDATQDKSPAAETPADTYDAAAAAKSLQEIRSMAQRSLLKQPLNARALSILGQVAIALDAADAERLMQAAARRRLRESTAIYHLMIKGYEAGNSAAALRYADVLLRSHINYLPTVMPVMSALAQVEGSMAELKKLLAENPPWREKFLKLLPLVVADNRVPLDLLLSLKETAGPPTDSEIKNYIKFLISMKDYQTAYYTWLQFLPPDQLTKTGLLFNGGFERDPSGFPFDWVFKAGGGTTIDIVPLDGDNAGRALFLQFESGRISFPGVEQIAMLDPGRYRLNGVYKGNLIGGRGLVWRVTCPIAQTELGVSAMAIGVKPEWTPFEMSFTVPETDCPAQRVRLMHDARSASEEMLTGSIQYDRINLERLAPVEAEPSPDAKIPSASQTRSGPDQTPAASTSQQ